MDQTLKGVSLDTFAEPLHVLPEGVMDDPYATVDILAVLGVEAVAKLEADYEEKLTADRVRKLPREQLEKLEFEDICRIRAGSLFSMSSGMEEMFDEDARYTMFDRIRSSMWHWGSARPTWNEYVAAYEGLRGFRIDLPDFEARITWTNTYCDNNMSDHCGTWLDGHFAYLIHYRGVHVMTLGFSIAGEGRLLLQQVQLASPRGNRWLFRIPGNRVEFAIDLFARAFPTHQILVVDGADLVRRNVAEYTATLRKVEARVERLRSATDDRKSMFHKAVIEQDQLVVQIAGLHEDAGRLVSLYGDCGRYSRGRTDVINRMTHYALAA